MLVSVRISRILFLPPVIIDFQIVGITTDLLVYTIAIPVFPFRLEALAYSGVSSLVGWLLFAYVRPLYFTVFFTIFGKLTS